MYIHTHWYLLRKNSGRIHKKIIYTSCWRIEIENGEESKILLFILCFSLLFKVFHNERYYFE